VAHAVPGGEVVADKALGQPTKPLKEIRPEIVAAAKAHVVKLSYADLLSGADVNAQV
jgi:hypothetical protein